MRKATLVAVVSLAVALASVAKLSQCDLLADLDVEVALAKPTIERARAYLSQLDESSHQFSAQQLLELESASELGHLVRGCTFERQQLLEEAQRFFGDNKLMSIYLLHVINWQRKLCQAVEVDLLRHSTLSLLVGPKLVRELFGHFEKSTDSNEEDNSSPLAASSKQAEEILVDKERKISSKLAMQLLRQLNEHQTETTTTSEKSSAGFYSFALGDIGELIRLSELDRCETNDMRRVFAKATQFKSANYAIWIHMQNVGAKLYQLCSAKTKKGGLEAKALSQSTVEDVEMLFEHVDLDAFDEAADNMAKFRLIVGALKEISVQVLGPHGKPDKFYTRFGQGLYHSCAKVMAKLRKQIKINSIQVGEQFFAHHENDNQSKLLKKWSTIYQLCEFIPSQLLDSSFISKRVGLELNSSAAFAIYADFGLPADALWDTLPLRVSAERVIRSTLKQAELYSKKRSDLKRRAAGRKYIQELAFVCRNYVDPLESFAWLNNAGYLFDMTNSSLVGTFIVIRVCDSLNRVGLTNLENYWRDKSNNGLSGWLENMFHRKRTTM